MSLSAENYGALTHVRDAVQRILLKDSSAIRPVSSANEIVGDMAPREVEGYSVCRAINGCVTQDMSAAGLEREVSAAIEKGLGLTRRSPHSFFYPSHLPYFVRGGSHRSRYATRAEYQVGTPSAGGNLVETELRAGSFIEVLRNLSVTGQLGATYLTGLTGNINIPRQDTQTQTYWVGESSALTESEATFDQVQLRPHVVGALSKMSRLMLQQSTPTIEQLVRDDLLEVTALAIDAAALMGSGTSSQPTGIANTSGVGSVVMGANGANLTFDAMIALYAALLEQNVPQSDLAYAINGKTKGYLATLKSTTGQYLWNPTQSVAGSSPDTILGYRYAVSNQLPYTLTKGTSTGNCSMAMFGSWKELLIGEWGIVEIVANPYDSVGFTTGDILIRSFATVDIGIRHPASFCVISDALTPGF